MSETYMTSLSDASRSPQPGLNLAHVNDAVDADYFQLSVIMIRLLVLILSLQSPRIRSRRPAVFVIE